jgi:hypothetical protein
MSRLTWIGSTLGSALIGFPFVALSASALPVAQLPSQSTTQSTTTETITIPSTGDTIQLSQLRVATIPPAPQNPCPNVYYESPHNLQVVVPAICSPNLITQQLDQMGLLQQVRANGTANITRTTGNTGNGSSYSPNVPY